MLSMKLQSLTSALESYGKTGKVFSTNMAEFHATVLVSTILHRHYSRGEASTCFIEEESIRTSYRHVPDARLIRGSPSRPLKTSDLVP